MRRRKKDTAVQSCRFDSVKKEQNSNFIISESGSMAKRIIISRIGDCIMKIFRHIHKNHYKRTFWLILFAVFLTAAPVCAMQFGGFDVSVGNNETYSWEWHQWSGNEQTSDWYAEQERIKQEQYAREQAERERAQQEQYAREQAERERLQQEQYAREQAEKERVQQEQ